MIEAIDDNNCIIKAFENNPIAILQENVDNKKVFYFKAIDIGKAIGIKNIAQNIQNYDEDEKVICKAYDLRGCEQDTTFLTSQGVYRVLYNSKKEIAKKFRKWAGNILDDIIFNEAQELKRQLEEKDKLLQIQIDKTKTEVLLAKERVLIDTHRKTNVFYISLFKYKGKWYIKFGISEGSINVNCDILNRITTHKNEISKELYLVHIIKIENCKELENRFKQRVITIEKAFTNNEIKTEIIELNETVTIESVIKLAEKLSKIKPTLNNELEIQQEKTKQIELQEKIKQMELQEKTKQMELQIKLLEFQNEKTKQELDLPLQQEEINNQSELTFEETVLEETVLEETVLEEENIEEVVLEENFEIDFQIKKKELNKQKCKEYYENNKELVLQKNKDYYENNKELVLQKNKDYYENNKEKKIKKQKEYYEKNKELVLQKRKDWKNNNKEILKKKNKEYRERTKDIKKEFYKIEENRKKLLEQKKAYYEKNKDEINKRRKEFYYKNRERLLEEKRIYYIKNK